MTKKVSNGFIRKAVYEKYNGHCAYCGCEKSLITSAPLLREWLSDMES